MRPETTWYHGGPRIDGDWVLPPAKTGVESTDSLARDHGWDVTKTRSDRVFITTSYAAAVMFSAGHAKPWVYVVAPTGPVHPDPDFDDDGTDVSAMCLQARIVRRLKPSNLEVAQCVEVFKSLVPS